MLTFIFTVAQRIQEFVDSIYNHIIHYVCMYPLVIPTYPLEGHGGLERILGCLVQVIILKIALKITTSVRSCL